MLDERLSILRAVEREQSAMLRSHTSRGEAVRNLVPNDAQVDLEGRPMAVQPSHGARQSRQQHVKTRLVQSSGERGPVTLQRSQTRRRGAGGVAGEKVNELGGRRDAAAAAWLRGAAAFAAAASPRRLPNGGQAREPL